MSITTNSTINNSVNLGNDYHYVPGKHSRTAIGADKNCTFGKLLNTRDHSSCPAALVTYKFPFAMNPRDQEDLNAKITAKLNKEIDTLRMLNARLRNHPNIIRIFGFWDMNILLEKGEADLIDIIDQGKINPFNGVQYSNAQIHQFLRDGMNAVKALHNIDWVHLDLKPENFVIVREANRNTTLKLIDFNSACPITDRCDLKDVGTPEYLAPELWLYKNDKNYQIADQDLKKIDYWSFGWVGIMLLDVSLLPPWFDKVDGTKNPLEARKLITDYYQKPPVDTDPLISICRKMCVLNPAERLAADEALATVELAQI